MSDTITDKLESLFWDPQVDQFSLVPRLVVQALRFIYAVLRDIVTGNITLRAMGLVYITILSIVPAIAIIFRCCIDVKYVNTAIPMSRKFFLYNP